MLFNVFCFYQALDKAKSRVFWTTNFELQSFFRKSQLFFSIIIFSNTVKLEFTNWLSFSWCQISQKYISCSDNSWLRFWCQKVTNPFSQISNGRISASFYRLTSFEMYVRHLLYLFQKTEKILSFLVYLNQKWQK